MSTNRLDRRRFLAMSGATLATVTGLATIMGSAAHDGHDHEGPAATPGASPVADANTFTIELHDTFFTPKELTIPADVEVTLKLVNKGLMQHDFTCEPLKIASKRLNGGDEQELKVTAKKGTYQFSCTVPGHKILGMVGTLKVV